MTLDEAAPGQAAGAGSGAGRVGEAGRVERRWTAPYPIDVASVLRVHRRGYGDPAHAVDEAGAIWRACLTPDGAGSLRVSWRADRDLGTTVSAAAWGSGADWLLAWLPAMLGADDRPSGFVPRHEVLRAAARNHPGWRIGKSGLVLEALVPAVLEQKVVGKEATRAWQTLLRRFGEPAPDQPRPACGYLPAREPGLASRPGTGTGPALKPSGPGPSPAPPG